MKKTQNWIHRIGYVKYVSMKRKKQSTVLFMSRAPDLYNIQSLKGEKPPSYLDRSQDMHADIQMQVLYSQKELAPFHCIAFVYCKNVFEDCGSCTHGTRILMQWQAHVSAMVIFDIRLWQSVILNCKRKSFTFYYDISMSKGR